MVRFWIVVKNKAGKRSFTTHHDTFESAKAEAVRLAEKEAAVFVVLEATHIAQLSGGAVQFSGVED